MARVVVGNPFENQIGTVGPTASPVDTYVRPAVQRGEFQALADTLTKIKAKADPILARQEKRAAERELAQGQQLYNETRINIGEAVKNGVIDAGASPYVRKGYRIAQMGAMSARYTQELENALSSGNLHQNGDPAAIDKFVGNFQQKFMEANGLNGFSKAEVADYFGNAATKSNEAFRGAWQTKHIGWQKEQAFKAFETQVIEVTTALYSADMSQAERSAADAQLAVWLQDQAAGHAINGLKTSTIQDTIVTALGIVAEDMGDMGVLEVFKKTKLGTAAMGSSLAVIKAVEDIEDRVARAAATRITAEDKAHDAKVDEIIGTESMTILQGITDGTITDETFNAAISRMQATGDTKAADQAMQLDAFYRNKNDYNARGVFKTVDEELQFQATLKSKTTERDVIAFLNTQADAGRVGGRGEATSYLNKWRESYDPAKGEQLGLKFEATSSVEGAAMAQLKKIIGKNDLDYNAKTQLDASNYGQNFRIIMTERVKRFSEANNGAMPDQLEMGGIAQLVLNALIAQYAAQGAQSEDIPPTVPLSQDVLNDIINMPRF